MAKTTAATSAPDIATLLHFLEGIPAKNRPDINSNDGYQKLLSLFEESRKTVGSDDDDSGGPMEGPRTLTFGIMVRTKDGIAIQHIEEQESKRPAGKKGKLDPSHPDEVFKRRKAMQAAMQKGKLVKITPV